MGCLVLFGFGFAGIGGTLLFFGMEQIFSGGWLGYSIGSIITLFGLFLSRTGVMMISSILYPDFYFNMTHLFDKKSVYNKKISHKLIEINQAQYNQSFLKDSCSTKEWSDEEIDKHIFCQLKIESDTLQNIAVLTARCGSDPDSHFFIFKDGASDKVYNLQGDFTIKSLDDLEKNFIFSTPEDYKLPLGNFYGGLATRVIDSSNICFLAQLHAPKRSLFRIYNFEKKSVCDYYLKGKPLPSSQEHDLDIFDWKAIGIEKHGYLLNIQTGIKRTTNPGGSHITQSVVALISAKYPEGLAILDLSYKVGIITEIKFFNTAVLIHAVKNDDTGNNSNLYLSLDISEIL